ncbi:hypothetical protein TrST_g7328 [Triparma strigata]|uniref:Tyrosine-protein kinase ephrin type A/B receptor-like domain-containing protein n=1 Tax=Triparma strigata TaxID=1606541 RepID=A0A9W7BME0_9STRA|nr:hypothetical protein TrST_g7328 [Triparma strigata]
MFKHINSGATGDESSVCSNCASGKYSGTASATCSICAAGKYASSESSSEWTICPAGKYNADQATNAAYHTSYSACSPGTNLEDDGTDAEKHNAADDCELCGPGYYSNEEGNFSEGGSSCGPCEKGHGCPGGTDQIACRPGSYQPDTSQASCLACPAGKYQQNSGEDACVDCPAGYFCPERTVNPITCGSAALFCPLNSEIIQSADEVPLSTETTAKRENQAVCEVGHACVGGVKTKCEDGTWADAGSSVCTPCPQYEEQDASLGYSSDSCVCKPTFVRDPTANKCSCEPGFTLTGETCSPCEIGRFKDDYGVHSCSRCEDVLKGSVTKFENSTDVGACACPKGTYDNMEKSCVDVFEGVDRTTSGMTLETLKIEPGYWRTNSRSPDVRVCPVSDACTGGNSTNYCREGHTGPYCKLCIDGWTEDPLMLCKSCENSTIDVIVTIVILVLVAAAIGSLVYISKKKSRDSEEHRKTVKRFKNGGKIIFAGAQITASLPSFIPAIDLPNNFKEALKAASILNIDVFNMVSVGCWAGSVNYYSKALIMTLMIIAICGVLILTGQLVKKHRSKCFTSAIAITYLVLPTVTTKIFGLFPCDELDDGSEILRKDYTISCQDDDRDFWEAYGWLMVGVFPIGVISMYGFLPWSKREKLKKPVEQRLEDEEITPLAFLWEPYKPEFWYWEVIETGRRLMMTGVLSTIKPGSFSQLVAGLMMNILYFGLLCQANPYNDNRDNSIAVLSTLQIIVIFIASMLMHASKLFSEDGYDAEVMGVLLIVSQAIIIVLFLAWAFYQKDDMSTSSNGMAIKSLKGSKKKKKKEKKNDEEEGGGEVGEMAEIAQKRSQFVKTSSVSSSFSTNEDVWIEHKCEEGGCKGETYYHQPSTGKAVWERPGEGASIKIFKGSKKKTKEKRNDKEEGGGGVVEMAEIGVDIGLGSRKSSVFEAENPMARKGGEQISGGFRQEGGGRE